MYELQIKAYVMKRITILLIAIITSIFGFAQNKQYQKTHENVKEYMEKSIFPELQKQQSSYLKELSENEIDKLEKIKGDLTFRNEKKGHFHQDRGNRNNKNGKMRNEKFSKTLCFDEVKGFTESHPEQNKSYKKFIESNKQKWIDDINSLHENGTQPMNKNGGNMRMEKFFERISNPEWLLLWDSSHSQMMNTKSKRNHRHNYHGRKCTDLNTEIGHERYASAMSNMVPVIAAERKKFDSNLSDSERETIETTRQKIEVRRIMFMNWRESEDFVPGQRAADPDFDGIREDMRNSMDNLREIASTHESQIVDHFDVIKSNSDDWEIALNTLSTKPGNKQNNYKRRFKHNRCSSNSSVMFLLFDPDKFSKLDFDDKVKVVIYPNPVINKSEILVTGALEKNIQIKLYSKDGNLATGLFDGQCNVEELKIDLNADMLDNDIYMLKVTVNDNDITRKIIVSK